MTLYKERHPATEQALSSKVSVLCVIDHEGFDSISDSYRPFPVGCYGRMDDHDSINPACSKPLICDLCFGLSLKQADIVSRNAFGGVIIRASSTEYELWKPDLE